ncbi:Protein of unknown function DUF54 [Methanosalsum zhilinae DSM 4017]|uniref:UPF0201 protein Mzhil_2008 n=1 Tax=Methanosalsum zhilinae (strain DSM 4017 / NBRC 107636 / OCM 62 / WeN5) TaxID=679901 RepID=F7XL29_METZD|nr:RNA-binding domain-containing protein [Methanosalsum zhilinae]AEH61841.1 Protein of unknown function DUF54 [Methanosalsum zhilinae DSM 4017]
MIDVEISAAVNPTENCSRIMDGIDNIFPQIEMELKKSAGAYNIIGHGKLNSLERMHDLLRKEKILDTARKELEKGQSSDGSYTCILINKQVATVGHINFPATEEPLGSIHLTIKAHSRKELESLFEWLAPHTRDGVPETELDISYVKE